MTRNRARKQAARAAALAGGITYTQALRQQGGSRNIPRLSLGAQDDGSPATFHLSTDGHLLVAGMAGSGKTVLLESLGEQALAQGMDVVVTAGDADTFTRAESSGGIVYRPADMTAGSGVSAATAMLSDVYAEMGVRSHRLLVMVDGFESVISPYAPKTPTLQEEHDQVWSLVGRIARESQRAGVTLVIAAQRLDVNMFGTTLGAVRLWEDSSRVLMGHATLAARNACLRNPHQVSTPVHERLGDGLWEPLGGAPRRFSARRAG